MAGLRGRESRWLGFCIIGVCYIIATLIGIIVFNQIAGALWLKLLLADIVATLFIWISSMIFRNASLYDPYWSVQPIVILTLLLIQRGRYDLGSVLIYSVVIYWGLRLTANWAYTFNALSEQDWRYDQIKNNTGKLYQLVNLVGIQMMPTFIVYLCLLPAAYYINQNGEFNIKSMIGIILCMAAVTLQLIADTQMQIFRKTNTDKSKLIRNGLWKHSRHPNYFGEILMWWGIYTSLYFSHPDQWYLCAGALANTLLFLFISIPLSEKRLAGYKEGYEEYKKETRMLLPFPKNFKSEDENETIHNIYKNL